jgi:hypothetical protein
MLIMRLNGLVAAGISLRMLAAIMILLAVLWPGDGGPWASSLLSDGGPAKMTIDLLPGNDENTIDLGKQRLVGIAILGSETFDVNDLNPRTLKLQATTQNLVGKSDKSLCKQQDVNADTHMDLVCDIKVIGFRVEPGEIPVVIRAGTYHRQSLQADGLLRYVAE